MLGKQIFDCDDAANGIGICICLSVGWGFSIEVRSLIAMMQ